MEFDDNQDSLQDRCEGAVCDKQSRVASKLMSSGYITNPMMSGAVSSNMSKPFIDDVVSPSQLTGNDLEIWREIQQALDENRKLDFLNKI